MVSRQTSRLAENLAAAIEDNNDPETVRAGAPAYLIMIDGLIHGEPQNEALLRAGANIYSAYANVFITSPLRRQRLTDTAMRYAERALCLREASLCQARQIRFQEYQRRLDGLRPDSVASLYTLAVSWAGWIQARRSDWQAMAQLPQVEVSLKRVLELNERHRQGGAHLYLGALNALRPQALGGNPEISRFHFERAIRLSGGHNLMAKVMFAKGYARLVFNRTLHDRLLTEVLQSDPTSEGFTLMNILAQQQAKALLAESDEYF
ncbi:TRAP transporter TatT component family protein [Marinobacterium arenosum]|uniref:TRAP transporter TatT component family protein n=1 Tax=Marinobacterium arenosum TaxID=2862496 RepID=UPI001C98375C|nr:TRAP transporter TatT component family protein [Marinobacterium arenosum]MBY4675125.1 TRAP transporter TatT component family protein [Marinobacterium arenosum]